MSDLLFSVFPNENFVDLGLYQYGWEQCAPAHSFGPAARNHYIFHYVASVGIYVGRIRRSSGPRDCHNRRSEPESPRLSCKFKGTSQPDDGRNALSEPSSRRISVSSNWTSLFIFRLFHAFCCDSSCEAKRKYPGFLY